jgi:hypothetical protein
VIDYTEGVRIKTLGNSNRVGGSDLIVSLTIVVKHATAKNVQRTNHNFNVVSITS